MDVSPLPFLCVGLVAAVAAAFFLVCSHIVTRRMTARAGELQHQGASESELSSRLVADGYDPQSSARVAAKVFHLAELERATELLVIGGSAEEAQERLIAAGMERGKARDLVGEAGLLRWCRRWCVLLVPLGFLLFLSGAFVCGWGLVLGDGPGLGAVVSRELVTVAGAGLISIGLLLLTGGFRKSL